MSAICNACSWTGTSSQVADGGRCPECSDKIRYDRAPVSTAPAAIRDVGEFNRRAEAALKGVDFGAFSNAARIVAEFGRQIAAGNVSAKMQQAAYNIVHRYRRQISDQLVRDFAVMRAKGAD